MKENTHDVPLRTCAVHSVSREETILLRVGFASTCITPPPGKDIPGLFERRLAEGVHDDLFARAVIIEDDASSVAFVQTDAIMISEEIVAEARKQASRSCGIPGKQCFIAATHTHSGGPVCGVLMSESDPAYETFVAQQIAAAIAEASRRKRPALTGVGTAQADGVAFNRRFVMKDGLQRTHPGKMNPDIVKPAGPANPTVTVLGFAEPDSLRPQGCIVHFACHATHMNGLLYSADYLAWVVGVLQAAYGTGFGVVCLNGACGDITQVDNLNPRPLELGAHWCERTGRVVAGAALQALARIDYNREATLATRTVKVRAGIRKSTPAQCRAARTLLAHKAVTAEDVETIYARELLEVESLRRKTPIRSLEIMGVRIADALFWGVPAEFFQTFAQQVQTASPFPHTCCVELANGCNGYICPKEAFKGGGYEVRTARSSLLEQDAGERIVAAAQKLCKRLYKDAEQEIRALHTQKVWPSADAAPLDGINQLGKKPQEK